MTSARDRSAKGPKPRRQEAPEPATEGRPDFQHIGPAATDIKDLLLQRLFAYWERKRQGRLMPSRGDLDPVELDFIMGQLILVDVLPEAPLRFRIRLHGASLVRRAGYDLTGKMLDELPTTEFRQLAQKSFSIVVDRRLPFHSIRNRILDDKPRRYESLMLPLSSDGTTVDMLLIGLRYSDMLP